MPAAAELGRSQQHRPQPRSGISHPAAASVSVPVFTVAGTIVVAVWSAAGWLLATRPLVAKTLSRCGHIILPMVLIGVGLTILIEGGAFGLQSLGRAASAVRKCDQPRA